ncbi:MerR family transcriptional regulator [Paracoccus sp. S3-43]|uniref:MerR family transcriptional regulator n=1 Tax=Paracoccus sp. S3-43 TaxID=3030011 RepID=UPI0023B19D87|nr:MerR family transcriptional regulator [Paracoccus sp. S3-43]WEF24236.1 MerR family transcriptional regulator [Paracoccus sp. S3-43]
MTKGADAFRSIGEVARLLGVAPHVLRYWETQFSLLKPMKRPDGRRYYRPDDVRLAAGLCTVLRDEGLTIRGAKMLLARDRGATLRERGSLRLADLPEPDATLTDSPRGEGRPDDTPWRDGQPDDPQPASGPKSRHRRRPAAAAPQAAKGHPAPGWLGRLVTMNARLRAVRPGDPRVRAGRRSLARLRDGLARIC